MHGSWLKQTPVLSRDSVNDMSSKSHSIRPLRSTGKDKYMQLVIEHMSHVMLCLH